VIDEKDIRLTLAEVLPRLVDAAKEQEGSRFLQWKLTKDCSAEDREKIFDLALPEIPVLANDVFGNFVVQKLMETGTDEQIGAMAEQMKGHMLDLSQHKYGCRVVQKVIQVLPPDLKVTVSAELGPKVVQCIENMHGNHVIQKIVEAMAPDGVDFVIDALAKSAAEMACHMYGCRIIQRLLENCASERLSDLLTKMLSDVGKLARDKHGNYVVQCILDHGRLEDKKRIVRAIQASLLEFAKNKVSSNVVEKCFTSSTVGSHAEDLKEERAELMSTVLGSAGDPKAPIAQLMHDKFGNYTVQNIIENSRGDDWLELCKRITAAEADLKNSPSGKHILSAMEKKKEKMAKTNA